MTRLDFDDALEQLQTHLKQLGVVGLPAQLWEDTLTPVPIPTAPSGESYESLDLQALSSIVAQCRKCRLCETRKKVVFGTGATHKPPIAFVGEGPGAEEDEQGEPFVGKAGQLLTAAITKGMGYQRSDVYICNVVKCRPPQNRTPLPDEVENCFPYLKRQLQLLQPQVIVTLGQPAQMALCGINMGITKLRGQWQQWNGIPLMPTFHPAYILRTPSAKALFWSDLKEVMKHLAEKST